MDGSGGRADDWGDVRDDSHALALSVLVVEDHPAHQQIERALFEALGCYVTIAADGVEALAAAGRARFDLIVMDRHMPRCDGDCAALMIRATPGPSQRAIIACCSTDPPAEAIALLYDDVLAKPLRSGVTAALVQRVQHRRKCSPTETHGSSIGLAAGRGNGRARG